LANTISRRIREKQGEISDDETVRFKSYLMSLGISDPVTRETHGSGEDYFRQLAKEIFRILEQPIKVFLSSPMKTILTISFDPPIFYYKIFNFRIKAKLNPKTVDNIVLSILSITQVHEPRCVVPTIPRQYAHLPYVHFFMLTFIIYYA
jgi:hypothetical protein